MEKCLEETRSYNKATTKKLLRNIVKLSFNANLENWGCKKDFFIKLGNKEHHPLHASQNLSILSLVLQLSNLGCFC